MSAFMYTILAGDDRNNIYVCMCVILCTILAGDDRNDVCMSVFM